VTHNVLIEAECTRRSTVYALTHPALGVPPLTLQASTSPVAGKRARSTTPSLGGGRRAKPAGGSPRPPLVRIAPSARLPLQREAAGSKYRTRPQPSHANGSQSLSWLTHPFVVQGLSVPVILDFALLL
jgi:hypothetical protein